MESKEISFDSDDESNGAASQLERLSEADIAKIDKVSKIYTYCTSMSPEDIRQEAYVRFLNGKRNRPSDVPLVKFLCESMRSIVSSEVQKKKRRDENGAQEVPVDLIKGFSDTYASSGLTQEEVLIDGQNEEDFKTKLAEEFESDEEAYIVLLGIFEGLRGEALCKEVGCDKKKLAAIKRRIERKMEKLKQQSIS